MQATLTGFHLWLKENHHKILHKHYDWNEYFKFYNDPWKKPNKNPITFFSKSPLLERAELIGAYGEYLESLGFKDPQHTKYKY